MLGKSDSATNEGIHSAKQAISTEEVQVKSSQDLFSQPDVLKAKSSFRDSGYSTQKTQDQSAAFPVSCTYEVSYSRTTVDSFLVGYNQLNCLTYSILLLS